MKILVTYYSETGNTKKVAEAIYEVADFDKEIKPVQAIQDTSGYDIIFCGFPVHAHSVPQKVIEFIKLLPGTEKLPSSLLMVHYVVASCLSRLLNTP